MARFKRRAPGRNWRGFLFKCFIAILLVVIAIFSIRAAWEMYGRFSVSSEQAVLAKQDLASLQVQAAQVKTAVENLSSERGVEAQVRERYGVAKPGEGEIQIVHSATSSDNLVSATPGNIIMRILRSLFIW